MVNERLNFLHSVIALDLYPRSYEGTIKISHQDITINKGALQDLIFVGQERKLTLEFYNFPIFRGIGTGRYSEGINEDLVVLTKEGLVMGSASLYNPVTLLKIPENPPEYVQKLRCIKKYCADDAFLSFFTAYLQSRRKEKLDNPKLWGNAWNRSALVRLGWRGNKVFQELESTRKSIDSCVVH